MIDSTKKKITKNQKPEGYKNIYTSQGSAEEEKQ